MNKNKYLYAYHIDNMWNNVFILLVAEDGEQANNILKAWGILWSNELFPVYKIKVSVKERCGLKKRFNIAKENIK